MPLFEEVASLITDAGIATLNTNLFGGMSRETPAGAGFYITLLEYSGAGPRRVHNDVINGTVLNTESMQRPQVQVVVRATTFAEARKIARRCYKVLNIRNKVLWASSRSVTLTRSGAVVTATTAGAHGWVDDMPIDISGAVESGYNGTHIITVTGATSFTYGIGTTPTSPATGTIVAAYPGTRYSEIQPMQEPFELGLDATGRPRVVFNLRILKGPS